MNVQCEFCGHVQDFDVEYPLCLNCGSGLDGQKRIILQNPRIGKGMQGSAILAFIACLAVYLFYSKYIGWYGMGISALFYVWGIYKTYLNKLNASKQGNDKR